MENIMDNKIEDILEQYNIHENNSKKVASADIVEKAKLTQEKIAQAIIEDDDLVEKIASGLTDEERKILKYADFI